MYTATKTGKDAEKTASKRVVHKTAEAAGDFIVNKIGNKITSLGKTKSKKKQNMRDKKSTYHQKKRQQIIDDLRLL